MFARVKESRNGDYLQIVQNYRDSGKVHQRMVLYVGHYDSLEHALKIMPRDVSAWRRRATTSEKKYDAMYGHRAGPTDKYGEELRRRAERERREAEGLALRLDALRRLVKEYPGVVERDRARAERRRQRVNEAFTKRRAALRVVTNKEGERRRNAGSFPELRP
jgi:hypothetical protein